MRRTLFADIVLTSPHCDPTIRQAAYTEIWRQIKELEASIRVLKTRHNALSITTRIPSEILCMIFEFVAGPRNLPWLVVTHVCTHWRQIAMDFPSLWRYVPSEIGCLSTLQEEMVSRAQGHSLDMRLNDKFSNKTASELARIASNNMHRIRTLSIHYSGSDLPNDVIHIIRSKPAPLLERLKILGRPRNFYFGNSFSLGDAFGGDAPRLRSLHLENFDLLWGSHILQNLTTLRLIHPPTQMPLGPLLAAISAIPNLCVLGLVRACIPLTKSEQSVHLDQLRRLELDDNLSMCISLLSHVTLSHHKPQFKIETDVLPPHNKSTELPTMLEGVRDLGNTLSKHNIGHMRCLSLRCVDSNIQFKIWERPGTCLRLPSEAPSLTVELRLRRANRRHGPVLGAFQNAISNKYLETLHVSFLVLGYHDWLDLFGALPILRNINVKYGEVFPNVLGACPSTLQNNESGSGNAETTASAEKPTKLPFKALRCLVTQYCRFDIDLDHLMATLRERRKRGFPLRKLWLLDPIRLESNTLERLQKVVKDVYVDPEKVWTAEALQQSYRPRPLPPYMTFSLDSFSSPVS